MLIKVHCTVLTVLIAIELHCTVLRAMVLTVLIALRTTIQQIAILTGIVIVIVIVIVNGLYIYT